VEAEARKDGSRKVMSWMISFTLTGSRFAVSPRYSERTRSMMSEARLRSLAIFDAALEASAMSGVSRRSHWTQAMALAAAAAPGWLISWARDAVNSPIMLTRFMRARSASS
jgi:hypothetical protein